MKAQRLLEGWLSLGYVGLQGTLGQETVTLLMAPSTCPVPQGVTDPRNSPANGGSNTYSADWETEAPGHTASVQEPKCHPRLSRIFAPSLSSERKTATSCGRGSRGGPAAARFCGLVGGPPPLLSSRRAAGRVSALSSIRLSPEVLCLGGFGGREPRGEGSSSRWQVSEMFRCAVDAFGHFWKILNYDLFEYLFFFSLSLPSPSAIPTASSHPGRAGLGDVRRGSGRETHS